MLHTDSKLKISSENQNPEVPYVYNSVPLKNTYDNICIPELYLYKDILKTKCYNSKFKINY